MNRSSRRWIGPVLLATAATIAVAVIDRDQHTEQHLLHRPAVEQRLQIKPADETVSEIVQAATPAQSCSGQHLEVALAGNIESVCLGTLITKHNGSVRSHQVSTLTAPQRWLRVEVAGGSILSVAWGSASRPDFHCEAAGCKGITIGRRDARGARVMTLERTALVPAHSNGMPSAQDRLQLSGRIEIAPEELPALACADRSVSIVTSDSSSQTFCPLGGAGFEIGDDGTKRYRFTSLDGESILVATDREQRIEQVQFEGEVLLACRSFECSSVRISAADAEGARRFTFSGTTLIETERGQSNAVLNGSLVLPPL